MSLESRDKVTAKSKPTPSLKAEQSLTVGVSTVIRVHLTPFSIITTGRILGVVVLIKKCPRLDARQVLTFLLVFLLSSLLRPSYWRLASLETLLLYHPSPPSRKSTVDGCFHVASDDDKHETPHSLHQHWILHQQEDRDTLKKVLLHYCQKPSQDKVNADFEVWWPDMKIYKF